jgi:hypothetical protein
MTTGAKPGRRDGCGQKPVAHAPMLPSSPALHVHVPVLPSEWREGNRGPSAQGSGAASGEGRVRGSRERLLDAFVTSPLLETVRARNIICCVVFLVQNAEGQPTGCQGSSDAIETASWLPGRRGSPRERLRHDCCASRGARLRPGSTGSTRIGCVYPARCLVRLMHAVRMRARFAQSCRSVGGNGAWRNTMPDIPSDRLMQASPSTRLTRRAIVSWTAKLAGGAALVAAVPGIRGAESAMAQDDEIILTAAASEVGARPGAGYAHGYAAIAEANSELGATSGSVGGSAPSGGGGTGSGPGDSSGSGPGDMSGGGGGGYTPPSTGGGGGSGGGAGTGGGGGAGTGGGGGGGGY